MVGLMAFSFLFSVGSHFLLKLHGYRQFLTYLQTIWDLLFVTVLLLLTGGVSSPYSFLYLLSIMNAGALLGRREALYTASLCVILYGALVDLQYFGYLNALGLSDVAAEQIGASRLFFNIFMNMLGFYLTSFITGYISDTARASEDELQKRDIDYSELERLNASIVSNIDSGLMTITTQGRIRAFNRYAEELTGKRLIDVYDLAVDSIFPQLGDVTGCSGNRRVGEFEYVKNDGGVCAIWYSTVPFTGVDGSNVGEIINIRDITLFRRMEKDLKQKERLAVLGELSARMAHEIRNPLASMGGAVQLLSEYGTIESSNRRLLAIILREAERLNGLVSDFLAYARPITPRKECLNLGNLVEELTIFLSADPRFRAVGIHSHVPAHFDIQVDANQFRQVLMNLFHNSADAMPQGGGVVVEAEYLAGGVEGESHMAKISVTDEGCGIDQETLAHLFEPFWTTKVNGTGLGLATVYRIIDGHGGKIQIEALPEQGCRVVMLLPGM